MKKVIALALAALMLVTIAFAQAAPNVTPGDTIKISKEGIWDDGGVTINVKVDGGLPIDMTGGMSAAQIAPYIPRSVNSTNYAVTNVKFKLGKGLVEKVEINDKEDRVDVIMADDLNNNKCKNFEVSFKLKGKAKYTLADADEVDSYNKNQIDKDGNPTNKALDSQLDVRKKVSLPDLDFEISGTVGYGQITVSLGDDGDEEIDGLDTAAASYLSVKKANGDPKYTMDDILSSNIFKFERSTSVASGRQKGSLIPMAGSYTADAILTQEYGDALTMEARVYHNDKIYFGIKYTPDKTIVNRLADSDADLDFYTFTSDRDYNTFNSNCTLYFNDADEDCFVYKVNDNGYLVPTGEFSEDDGCWVVKTRTLGRYVVSDYELSDDVVVGDGDPTTTNPDTGANDVVGIAAALAAVALVSAAAVSLKK